MKTFRLTAVALAAALSACVTVPSELPAATSLNAAQLGLSATSASVADASWWTAYGDAQLDRLMAQAVAGNPTLAQALARVREAQSQTDSAHAGLLPGISFDANETRAKLSGQDIIPPPFGGTTRWRGAEGLNLNWDLDFWGRQSALLNQARSNTDAAALDAAGARLALAGAVLKAYIELDHQYALADVAQRSVEQREQTLELTRQRVGAGIDTNVELRSAEAAVPQARVALRQAQAEQARAVHLLAALTGQGAGAYAQITRPQLREDAALALPQSLPADLLGRRPDVLAARARVEAATQGKAAAKAAFYPDVNLAAFVGTSAIGFSELFQSASQNYGVGAALHLPLFEAGRLKAAYRGAGAKIDDSIAAYNRTVLDAVRETADQLSALDALHDQLALQQQAIDAADSAWQLAGQRYRAGISGYLTVLNAETQLLEARRTRANLAAAQAGARVALLLAAGGDFTPSTH